MSIEPLPLDALEGEASRVDDDLREWLQQQGEPRRAPTPMTTAFQSYPVPTERDHPALIHNSMVENCHCRSDGYACFSHLDIQPRPIDPRSAIYVVQSASSSESELANDRNVLIAPASFRDSHCTDEAAEAEQQGLTPSFAVPDGVYNQAQVSMLSALKSLMPTVESTTACRKRSAKDVPRGSPKRPKTGTQDDVDVASIGCNSQIDHSGRRPVQPRTGNHDDGTWDRKFKLLEQYRAEAGHCRVPHSYKGGGELAQWVKRQRYVCR